MEILNAFEMSVKIAKPPLKNSSLLVECSIFVYIL